MAQLVDKMAVFQTTKLSYWMKHIYRIPNKIVSLWSMKRTPANDPPPVILLTISAFFTALWLPSRSLKEQLTLGSRFTSAELMPAFENILKDVLCFSFPGRSHLKFHGGAFATRPLSSPKQTRRLPTLSPRLLTGWDRFWRACRYIRLCCPGQVDRLCMMAQMGERPLR